MRHVMTLFAAMGLAFGVAACDIDQTREGELPEVEVREGQLPQYDIDTPEVEVGTRRETVEVPNVEVETQREQIQVPTVGIDMPEDEAEEIEQPEQR